MRAARIVEGRIVELFDGDRAALVGKWHPDFIAGLVDVPATAQIGDEVG